MLENIVMALAGGVLIGLAATLFLVANGRVTGIAGIASGVLGWSKGDRLWRLAFLGGLAATGAVVMMIQPALMVSEELRSTPVLALAGFLVGFGAITGSGCTSGHGVCGLARFSPRSLLATAVFMASGFLTATLIQIFVGGF